MLNFHIVCLLFLFIKNLSSAPLPPVGGKYTNIL
jgi:hypothetical protein